MSYEKQTWAAGDKITSAKLNHMEDGIFQNSLSNSSNLIIPFNFSSANSLSLSYNEIIAMLENNALPYLHIAEDEQHTLAFLGSCNENQDGDTVTYAVHFYTLYPASDLVFTANDADEALTKMR